MAGQLTNHSRRRMKERLGMNERKAMEIASRAYRKGITHKETKGALHRLLSSIYLRHNCGNQLRIYHGYLYIFQNSSLVTAYALPEEYQRYLEDYLTDEGKEHFKKIKKSKPVDPEKKLKNEILRLANRWAGDERAPIRFIACDNKDGEYVLVYESSSPNQKDYQAYLEIIFIIRETFHVKSVLQRSV